MMMFYFRNTEYQGWWGSLILISAFQTQIGYISYLCKDFQVVLYPQHQKHTPPVYTIEWSE